MILYLIACICIAVLFGGAYYAYRTAFFSPMEGRERVIVPSGEKYEPYMDKIREFTRSLRERPCEYVTVTSFDGLTLSGRYYHVKDGAPLGIGFHGYRSSGLNDFAGGSRMNFDMGHNLLLVDQRAHGKSQGRTICFGIKERQDLLSWVNYAVERFGKDVQILLYGVSMGGATVLMASDMELPENVKGIVADCPYASALEIIRHVGRNNPGPQWLIGPFAILGAKIFGGFDLNETDAYRAVRNSRVPILIIHGEADGFVPMKMSDLVLRNPEKVRRCTFPGADHAFSYLVDETRYRKLVKEFADKVL